MFLQYNTTERQADRWSRYWEGNFRKISVQQGSHTEPNPTDRKQPIANTVTLYLNSSCAKKKKLNASFVLFFLKIKLDVVYDFYLFVLLDDRINSRPLLPKKLP